MRSFIALPVLTGLLALTTAAELPLTPVATAPAQKPSVFVLTKVPAGPTSTGTPTNPDKCSQVAARITPQLTPTPTYAPSLKAMADKMGGVDRDTCGEMDFKARFKTSGSDDLNRFQQTRHTTFILPIWAKVSELYNACGDQAGKMPQVAQEPCYRWALDLTKASNSSGAKGVPPSGQQGGNIKTAADLEAGAAQSSISNTAVVGAMGVLTLLWAVVLA
ncbi:hypothetical protein F5144DRAFT_539068 [Chaetomium tenue]|uniref:Uncharacterized protein n=1 Tax=Chaetomium tenue TaxID=1854479 RepID=A0ACB7NYH9_9PEZI|nr:hypothetical protein F5144DRAFT_539068 [Chaetomium globosum]